MRQVNSCAAEDGGPQIAGDETVGIGEPFTGGITIVSQVDGE
jgi:hypothetical protein